MERDRGLAVIFTPPYAQLFLWVKVSRETAQPIIGALAQGAALHPIISKPDYDAPSPTSARTWSCFRKLFPLHTYSPFRQAEYSNILHRSGLCNSKM